MSVNAYRRAQEIAATPRSTEYRLMSEVTAEMIAARDVGLSGAALMPALHRNRCVWSTFAVLCADDANQLAPALRAQIISIALWVERFTTEVARARESIDDLIQVNRTIIEGLTHENREISG